MLTAKVVSSAKKVEQDNCHYRLEIIELTQDYIDHVGKVGHGGTRKSNSATTATVRIVRT